MTGKEILSLDKLCADSAQKALDGSDKKALETLATKTLGVLQSQGIYAMMLFLFSRKDEEAGAVRKALYEVLLGLPYFREDAELRKLQEEDKSTDVLEWLSENVLADIDRVLLLREVFEKVLTYIRFHAKAEQ